MTESDIHGIDGYRRPRILFVASVDWSFVSHRLPLALAVRALGWDVHVAATPSSKKSQRQMSQAGITFHALPQVRGATSVVAESRVLFAIYSLHSKLGPDVVHLITAKPVIYGGIVARIRRTTAVVSAVPGLGFAFVQQGIWASWRRRLLLLAYRVSLSQRNGIVIFQNKEDRALFTKRHVVPYERTALIAGSGVDERDFVPMAPLPGPVTVTFASRLLKEKGVAEFVEAARILRSRGVGARFLIAGDVDVGNPGTISRSELETWDASGVIEWIGFQSDMRPIFAQSHIFCLPSYYGEGVPKVLIEAAACGLPIVTTDMPGCRDIGRRDSNALLVIPRDVRSLTDALLRLITDEKLRDRLGAASRKLAVEEFSLEIVVGKTLELYRKLLRM